MQQLILTIRPQFLLSPIFMSFIPEDYFSLNENADFPRTDGTSRRTRYGNCGTDSPVERVSCHSHLGETVGTGRKKSDVLKRKRAIISPLDACRIFSLKEKLQSNQTILFGSCIVEGPCFGNSVQVSKLFGISPKAVRDVWNR